MIVSVVAYFVAKVEIKIEMTKKKKKNPFLSVQSVFKNL